MPGQPEEMQEIARRIHFALDNSDLNALGELLDPEVHWGAPGARKPACKNRGQVVDWYMRAKSSGVEARVCEVEVDGTGLMSLSVWRSVGRRLQTNEAERHCGGRCTPSATDESPTSWGSTTTTTRSRSHGPPCNLVAEGSYPRDVPARSPPTGEGGDP